MDIGQEIIVLRARNGWTQQQFAEQLKTTQRTVAAWEGGDSVPRKAMRVRIAQAFGLPDQYFLVEDGSQSGREEKRPGVEEQSGQKQELLDEISHILFRSGELISEEKKNLLMKTIHSIIEMPK